MEKIIIDANTGLGRLLKVVTSLDFYGWILISASGIFGLMIGNMIATYVYGPIRKFSENVAYLFLFLFMAILAPMIPVVVFGIKLPSDVFTLCVFTFSTDVVVAFIARSIVFPIFKERKKPAGLSPMEYLALNMLLQGKNDKEIVGTLVSKGLTPEKAFECLDNVKDKVVHSSEKFRLLSEKISDLEKEIFEVSKKVAFLEKKIAKLENKIRGEVSESDEEVYENVIKKVVEEL